MAPQDSLPKSKRRSFFVLLGQASPGRRSSGGIRSSRRLARCTTFSRAKFAGRTTFRPLMRDRLAARGQVISLCAHPYDLCTAPLLCSALGVVLTNPLGGPFDAPMSLEDDVAW